MEKKQEITYGRPFYRRVITLFGRSVLGSFLGAIFVIIIGMALDSTFLKVVAQIISITMFVGIIYATAWNEGDKDKNLVGFGRIKEDKLKGVKLGLVVMIPYMLSGILLLLGLLGVTTDLQAIYRIIHFQILVILNELMDAAKSSWNGLIFGTLYYLIVPIASGVGYYLGYKRIAVLNKIMYGKQPTGADKK